MYRGPLALPGFGYYLAALLLSPLLLGFFDRSERISKIGRLLLSILVPLLLIAAFSPMAFKVLPASPDLRDLREVFGPAIVGAIVYGAALSNRPTTSRLAILAAAALVLAAYLRVSEAHRFVLDTLPRHEELELEMTTLKSRLLVINALFAAVVFVSAILRARGRNPRAAAELLAFLVGGAFLFLPRAVPSSLPASEIAGIGSPRLLGGDLYFSARLRSPRKAVADDQVGFLLCLRKGKTVPVSIWPRGVSGLFRRPVSERADDRRFVVWDQRWWYLLTGEYTREEILDTGNGGLETVFRYHLHAKPEDSGPRSILFGPGRSWIALHPRAARGRLSSGKRFELPLPYKENFAWIRGRSLKILSRLEPSSSPGSLTERPLLTSVDLSSGKTARTQLPVPVRIQGTSPAGDEVALWELRRASDGTLERKLYWLHESGDIVPIDDWRGDRGPMPLVVWPENGGTPTLKELSDSSLRSSLSVGSCREIGGQCLALGATGPNPRPYSFPPLLQIDPETGSTRTISAVAGAIQWLSDSVVFAEVGIQRASGKILLQHSIVRYWPRDGRREVRFSTPPEKPYGY